MHIFCLSDLWMPFPGGAERFLVNICRKLADHGHKITVLTSYAPALETDPRLKLVIRDIGVYEKHAEGWQCVQQELKTANPHIILTHHFFAYEFREELFDLGYPVVQVVHNGKRQEKARLAVFNSHYTYQHSNPQEQDMVIHPPAFGDIIAPHLGESIGMVKPLEHKGIRFVYELAKALPHRHFLVLKGEWEDHHIIEDHPNVEFMNPVQDIREFYSRCNLMVMPSLSEDAGTIAQEAALNRMPCISSNAMGLTETNAGGIMLPIPLDVGQWTPIIEWLLTDATAYQVIVKKQRLYLDSLQWDKKFAEFNQKVCSLL